MFYSDLLRENDTRVMELCDTTRLDSYQECWNKGVRRHDTTRLEGASRVFRLEGASRVSREWIVSVSRVFRLESGLIESQQ